MPPPSPVSGRQIARSTLVNVAGNAGLVLLSIAFAPLMVRAFGLEGYGVLSMTWLILGHAVWLEFGLASAVTYHAARALALGETREACRWARAAILPQLAMGVAVAAALVAAAPAIGRAFSSGDAALASLTARCLALAAVALPLDWMANTLSSVLRAGQRFGALNVLSLAARAATYVVYAGVIYAGGNLIAAVYGLLALRAVNLVATLVLAGRVLPGLAPFLLKPDAGGILAPMLVLLRYGGWMSVRSVVGGLLLYLDRWIIAGFLGLSAVTVYSIPWNALSRLALVPHSIAGPLMPAISMFDARGEESKLGHYAQRAQRFVSATVLPVTFALFVWTDELLQLWMGAEFARLAGPTTRLLIAAYAVGLLTPVATTLLDGLGKPGVVAKLQMVELPLNTALVYVLCSIAGVMGAAGSFLARAVYETLGIWAIAAWVLRGRVALRAVDVLAVRAVPPLLAGAAALAALRYAPPGMPRFIGTLIVTLGAAAAIPLLVLSREDWSALRRAGGSA